MRIISASYVMPVTAPPIKGGAVVIDGGRIVAAGPCKEMLAAYSAPIEDYPGCVIMPGLVNPHTHLELTHFPAWKLRNGMDYDPRTYVDWVIQVIKIRRALTHDELVVSLLEGIRACLASGTTAVGEIVTDRTLLPHHRSSSLSGRLFFEVVGQDSVRSTAVASFLEKLPDSDIGAQLPGLSPHSPHTLSSGCLHEMVSLGRSAALPLMIHLAESTEEGAFFHDSTGKIAELLYPFVGWESSIPAPRRTTATVWLDSLGAIGPMTTLVHCVHVTPADVQIIRDRGASIVLCPRSNDRLNVGRAPIALFRQQGVPLALGTDSLASNDSLSMWDEMRFLLDVFPGVFTPDDALAMSTIGAANALHCATEVGSLEAGKRADILVVKLGTPATNKGLAEAILEHGRVEKVLLGGINVV